MPTIAEIQTKLNAVREKLHRAQTRLVRAHEGLHLHQSGMAGPVALTTAQKDAIKTNLDALYADVAALETTLDIFLA